MNRAIIIHGWGEAPGGNWLPWVGNVLREKGWQVDIPEMPNTKNPKFNEWMDALLSLKPDERTVLVGHSLGNTLIMRFLERPESRIRGAVMVAAWDWLMEDVKEFHETFFETKFDYKSIQDKHIPLVVVNSSNDPWIDLERSRESAARLEAKFITVENAGHFMERDGYSEFPKLVEIIEGIFGTTED